MVGNVTHLFIGMSERSLKGARIVQPTIEKLAIVCEKMKAVEDKLRSWADLKKRND